MSHLEFPDHVKTRGGRPRLANRSDVRSVSIRVRVSPTEYSELLERATHMGMGLSRFLRVMALKRRLPKPPPLAMEP